MLSVDQKQCIEYCKENGYKYLEVNEQDIYLFILC